MPIISHFSAIFLGWLHTRSAEIKAVHVSTAAEDEERLREIWREKAEEPARLANLLPPSPDIIRSPCRQIYEPVLNFVREVRKNNPDRMIAIVLPELVESHWYEYVLHNMHASRLRALLFIEGDERTVVVNAPWYLHGR